jgi:hypothetical protein
VPEAVPAPLLSPALVPRALFPAVFLAGAGIDACHAVSMVALAAWDPRMRRAGIADALTATALTATAFTATGALTSSLTDVGAGIASLAVSSARPPG